MMKRTLRDGLFSMKNYSLACLLACSSCVDKIELPDSEHPPVAMLVEGKFIAGTPGHVTASVFELYTNPNELPKAIGGAQVVLQDDQGHELVLFSGSNGAYYQDVPAGNSAFPVQTGSRYRLVATLPGGRIYQSAWETLLPAVPVDSVHAEIATREVLDNMGKVDTVKMFRFNVDTDLHYPGLDAPVHFRWELGQSYRITDDYDKICYSLRALLQDNVIIFDNTLAKQDRLHNYILGETRLDYRFAEGYYFILYQQSISENACGYLAELYQLLQKKGTPFDPPAGSIRSNMTSPTDPDIPVHGFFYVAAQDTARLYISPETAGNPAPYCPIPPSIGGGSGPPNACDDCLLEAGGQLEKPDWWQ